MGPVNIKFNQSLQLYKALFLGYQKTNYHMLVWRNTPCYAIERTK